jgi:probable HAF family extracellular repeat protein
MRPPLSTVSISKKKENSHLKTIDVPFSTDVFLTRANDINNRGQIVGEYLDNAVSNQQHGFLNDRGVFSSIDVPNALITSASGINDKGMIVGYYEDTAGLHGFVLSGEEYTAVDVSFVGASNTIALGINNRGRIVGTYQTSAGIHGFTYYDGSYSTIAVPVRLIQLPPESTGPGKWWASTMMALAHMDSSRHRNAGSASQTTLCRDLSLDGLIKMLCNHTECNRPTNTK